MCSCSSSAEQLQSKICWSYQIKDSTPLYSSWKQRSKEPNTLLLYCDENVNVPCMSCCQSALENRRRHAIPQPCSFCSAELQVNYRHRGADKQKGHYWGTFLSVPTITISPKYWHADQCSLSKGYLLLHFLIPLPLSLFDLGVYLPFLADLPFLFFLMNSSCNSVLVEES